jgi:hypothetical protein
MAELKKVKDSDDASAIKAAMENLGEVSQELGKAIYEKVRAREGAAGGPGAGPGPGVSDEGGPEQARGQKAGRQEGGKGKVVDADFEVVDDK